VKCASPLHRSRTNQMTRENWGLSSQAKSIEDWGELQGSLSAVRFGFERIDKNFSTLLRRPAGDNGTVSRRCGCPTPSGCPHGYRNSIPSHLGAQYLPLERRGPRATCSLSLHLLLTDEEGQWVLSGFRER
jgi:hypothetical protein